MDKKFTLDSPSPTYRLQTKKPHVFILILLISFGTTGASIFSPAIPVIVDEFNISASIAQLSITIYMLGYAIGQLVYGPIANRFGRKPALYCGIVIALIGAIFCSISGYLDNYSLMLWGRLITALGSGGGLGLVFTIINDYFYETHARKITAYVTLAFAIISGIAIALGGVLVTHFGWESCFYFLIGYSIVLLYLCKFLPETSTSFDKGATNLSTMLSRYATTFKSKTLICYSMMFGMGTMFIYLFITSAPLIATNVLHFSPRSYGFLNLIPASGFIFGNVLTARITSYVTIRKAMNIGFVILFVGVVLFFILLVLMNLVNIYTLFIPAFIVYMGVPLIYSNGSVIAINVLTDKPSAASVMSFINISSGFVGLGFLGLSPYSQYITLPSLFLAGLIFLAFLFWITRRN